jgi:hypothetical protein
LPIPPFNLEIKVLEEGSNLPISNAQILLKHPQIEHQGQTNGLGQENLTLFYQDTYELIIGKWGYQTTCSEPLIDASTQNLVVYLKKGFYDDFTFDFGWSVIGNAETGMWERADPNPTTATVFDNDSQLDCGVKAMITGNGSSPNPDQNDVDNGFTTLISPIFDLNGLNTPHLNYARSFYCFHGPGDFDDTLSIILSNGLTQVVLEQLIAPLGDPMAWSYQSIALNGLLPFTNSMQLFIRTADYASHPNITEAAFDHFSISNASILELAQDANAKQFVLYPNPGQDQLFIEGIEEETTIDILQLDGKYCYRGKIGPGNLNVNTQQLPNGIYFVKVKGQCSTWVKTAQ